MEPLLRITPSLVFVSLVAVVPALFTACSSSAPAATADAQPVPDGGAQAQEAALADAGEAVEARLDRMLRGRFDSKDQAKQDASYFEIQLRVCSVEVKELGPRVLYVEQARMDALKSPYRQRLYVVERVTDEAAVSKVFEFKDPKPLVGACDKDKPPVIAPADVEVRDGCGVEMHWRGDRFEGSTGEQKWNGSGFEPNPSGKRCASSLSGATYATSSVTMTETTLSSWDRGFDAADKQVWGATKGPYVFVRRE